MFPVDSRVDRFKQLDSKTYEHYVLRSMLASMNGKRLGGAGVHFLLNKKSLPDNFCNFL